MLRGLEKGSPGKRCVQSYLSHAAGVNGDGSSVGRPPAAGKTAFLVVLVVLGP